MGLTPIGVWTFYWVSQVGMFAGTIVYVNAGTQLAQLESLSRIASPGLLVSFALLGIFPWLARSFVTQIEQRKHLPSGPSPSNLTKPDRDWSWCGWFGVCLYCGSNKAKVTLVEAQDGR